MFKSIIILALMTSVVCAGPRSELLWGIPDTSPPENPRHRRVTTDEDSLHDYDAVSLVARLNFAFATQAISGSAAYRVTSDVVLSRVNLRLTTSYTVDSVLADNSIFTVSVSWLGLDSLLLDLSPPLPAGDTLGLTIYYQGSPRNIDAWGGFHFLNQSLWHQQIGFSMGDGLATEPPPANYNWLPCYEDPADKLKWECYLTADFGTAAVSNGLLVDTVRTEDGSLRWHYLQPEPISTYLIFAAVSDYQIMVQRESNPWIVNFVYPSRWDQSQIHFANVPAVLDSFTARFGPYPFSRFGYNMTRTGDMEHATCVSHIDQAVLPNHAYDYLLFHEMSHMWWGDWVTCGDWRDLWLNEGFATFCEALGMEALGGRAAYQDYMTGSIFPAARAAHDSYSIYDPDYYWGGTVYQKGATVMHMLRELLGDSVFFAALREYGQEHAYGSAVTADWQAKLEEHYGGSLSWFFDEWVYGTGYPRYRVTIADSDIQLLLIEQIQATATLFAMPVDLWLISYEGDTVHTGVWTQATRDLQTWLILPNDTLGGFVFDRVVLDPGNKILKTAEYHHDAAGAPPSIIPKQFGISSLSPNPFNATTSISFSLPAPASVSLRVFDVQGRLTETLTPGLLSAGPHDLQWNGIAHASGLYFFVLSTPDQSVTAKAVLLK
jgi:aminopeptidase N